MQCSPLAGLGGGLIIGLPAVMNYGTEALKDKIVPDVLSGKKVGQAVFVNVSSC